MFFFNLQYHSLTIAVIALVSSLWALWNIMSLNKIKKTFFTGQTGADLEHNIQRLVQDMASLRSEQLATQNQLAALLKAFGFAVQKVGLVRFNPFAGGGGNFSFCVAFLDAHNNGVVITSMHGREQNRIYTKKITQGKSETQLTEEEAEAIAMANSKPEISNK